MHSMDPVEHLAPQLILEISDEELGLLGYVVIDRILSGPSIGGVRMRDGLTLKEVADLAGEMTLKFAFLNIPCGGAKAGVIWRPLLSDEERRNIFTAFGKQLGPVITKRMYCPGEDMGTSSIDIYHMKKGAGLDIARPASNNSASGYYTALTVFIIAERLADSLSLKLSGMRVVIEGLGKVGIHIAKLFSEAGAKIVGVSTIRGGIYNPQGIDIIRLTEMKKELGDEVVNVYPDAEKISKDDLIALKSDLMVPCAGPYTITKENVSQIKSKIVVPGANLAATAEAESVMHERGIHYVPSFVSSCGGILLYALHEHGFWGTDVERIMKTGFGEKISHLIRIARKENISISQKAKEIAESNLKILEQLTSSQQKEKLLELLRQRQRHDFGEILSIVLWKFYKLSFKFKASRLLRPFAIKYMEKKLSHDAPSWTDL